MKELKNYLNDEQIKVFEELEGQYLMWYKLDDVIFASTPNAKELDKEQENLIKFGLCNVRHVYRRNAAKIEELRKELEVLEKQNEVIEKYKNADFESVINAMAEDRRNELNNAKYDYFIRIKKDEYYKSYTLTREKTVIRFYIGQIEKGNPANRTQFNILSNYFKEIDYKDRKDMKHLLSTLSTNFNTKLVVDEDNLLTKELKSIYTLI